MNTRKSTRDDEEVNKFAQHGAIWWDTSGALKTLHDINPARMEWIMRHAQLKQASVLDVGCGGGILAEALCKAGARVIGLDAEAEAIAAARTHADTNNLSIEYHCTLIEDYEHAGFDVITCMEMLEHVKNPDLVIQHCKRLLNPGGILLLSTINRTLKAYASVIIAAEYILRLLPRQTHDYSKFITPSEICSMGRAVQLDLVDLVGLAYNPLSRGASLVSDVSTNYLLALR